jgi:hypothetical protein
VNNKLETKLWKEIGWLRFLLAIAITIILGVVYFAIWQWNTSIWRELLLSITANLIPIPLVFILAYIVFRGIEELRSERNADEIANKVILRLAEIAKTPSKSVESGRASLAQPIQFSPLELILHREFDITNKYFDSKSRPQKLVVQFTNRGNDVVRVRKASYSDTGLGLPKSALQKNYRLDNNGNYVLVNPSPSEIIPEGQYVEELCLDGKWEVDKINGWAGKWGYIHVELDYTDKTINLQYAI